MRIEFGASILVRGFSPLSGRVFLLGPCGANTMALINFPWGSPFCVALDCLRELSWPRRLSHSVHASGCIGQVLSHALHHTRLNTAGVPREYAHAYVQRARCVPVSSSALSHERRQPHLRRAHRRSPCLIACLSTLARGRTPAAALDRSTSSIEPGDFCFPTHQPLCFSPAVAGLQSYIIVTARTTGGRRSDRAKPTIFVALFDRLHCLIS